MGTQSLAGGRAGRRWHISLTRVRLRGGGRPVISSAYRNIRGTYDRLTTTELEYTPRAAVCHANYILEFSLPRFRTELVRKYERTTEQTNGNEVVFVTSSARKQRVDGVSTVRRHPARQLTFINRSRLTDGCARRQKASARPPGR